MQKLKDATIGFSGYPRLARDPQGGFGYIAILLAIVLAINGYIYMVQLRRLAEDLSRQLVTWPDFTVENGKLTFEGPMPFQRIMADGTLLVIDTTGRTTPESLAGKRAVLIGRDRIHLVEPGAGTRVYEFSRMRSPVTRESLRQFLASRPERALPFAYLFLYLFQLAFKAIDAVILALVALLYGRLAGRRVTFGLGFKLGLYAMSLPIILQWVWTDFHTWTATGFAIWWSLATIYLIFGLRACWASEREAGPVQG